MSAHGLKAALAGKGARLGFCSGMGGWEEQVGMSKAEQHQRRWLCFSTSSAAKHARDQELGGRERVNGDME